MYRRIAGGIDSSYFEDVEFLYEKNRKVTSERSAVSKALTVVEIKLWAEYHKGEL